MMPQARRTRSGSPGAFGFFAASYQRQKSARWSAARARSPKARSMILSV